MSYLIFAVKLMGRSIMDEAKGKLKVLFLCTGNSCRSQIAEGWARHLKSDVMDVYSAGVDLGRLNERAVAVMAEVGVDISSHYPKDVDEFKDVEFDYIVTVCDYAREKCPILPGRRKHLHKLFSDPSFMVAPEEEIMTAFRKLRDDIKAFIETMPQCLKEKSH